jgi:D-alanine-D-alanine ligase
LGVLGPAEYIYPDSHIYDYRLKTIDNDTITVLPNTNVPESVINKLTAISETAIRALSIRSYARLDYRLGSNGEIYLLEVNGQVSFHPIGAFVLACEPHGYDFDAVVHTITKNAFNRVQSDWVFGLR